MRAEIEIECKEPDIVIKSLEPDVDQNLRFNVKLEGKNEKLFLTVESGDLTGLLAGINSYMRLIRTSMDVIK